ncbi:hypothetical protein LAZ67_8002753 [Cordylochernes scorpioides]|uniref:Reverse transcriptase n=1 Tax=Cordylochernes scorpioides TaxID=51811 RepID=A0ABY6KRS6_9ARAC|nr:hypothetical protein LAZ67_8002753 [Cordylochernes scorpioides]
MPEILGQRVTGCIVPIQMIENHFEKHTVGDNIEFSPDRDLHKDFAPKDGTLLEELISSNEVWYRLLKMGNTAPGQDGISYQELRRVDPNATILTQIFQACFQMRAVPPSWKESSSILFHKKGNADDLGNWRLISLGNTPQNSTLRSWPIGLGDGQRQRDSFPRCKRASWNSRGALKTTSWSRVPLRIPREPAGRLASPGWTSKIHLARYRMNASSMC